MAVCIVKVLRQGKLESKRLEGDKFTFGRALESSVVMPHESISRNHLEMAFKNGRVFVKDMGSSNGTYLNGKKFKSGEIKEYVSGDTIRLGNCEDTIQIELKSEEAPKIPVEKMTVEEPRPEPPKFHLNPSLKSTNTPVMTPVAPTPSVSPSVSPSEVVKKAEESARAAVAAIHAEARSTLDAAHDKAHKIVDEAKAEAEKIQASAQQDSLRIAQEAKVAAVEVEKTAQALFDQAKESADKILNLKKQEAEIEKQELLKKWEKHHKDLLENLDSVGKKLEEKKQSLVQYELDEKDWKERIKKIQVEFNSWEEKLEQKQNMMTSTEAKISQSKGYVEDFERQIVDLKKKKEEALLEIKSLQSQAKINKENNEKDHIHQKERIRVEMAEIREKELADIRKLRLDELDHLDLLRRQAVEDIQKNQNIFTRGLSAKLEARFLKMIQEKSGDNYKDLKEGIYKSVLESFDEQIFEVGQGFEKDIRHEVKVATQGRQKGFRTAIMLGIGAVMGLAFVFVFQGGDLWKALQGINEAGLTAAEQYSHKMYNQRVENKFSPVMTPGFKESYTQNVLYTPFYLDKLQSSEIREKWIKVLNKFLTRDLALEDDSVVQLVAIESTLVSRLKAERDQINPEYLDVSLKKMEKLERESVDKIRGIFKNQTQYNRYTQFSKKFWTQEIDSPAQNSREAASQR